MDFQQPIQQQPNQQPISPQPEPNIQPNPVFTQPPKNNWKIAALVIVGVLILGGASYGAYYWQNNKPVAAPTDETANWQTYKNEQYGFEIKYPQNRFAYCDYLNGVQFNLWVQPFKCVEGHDVPPIFSISDDESSLDQTKKIENREIILSGISVKESIYKIDEGPFIGKIKQIEVPINGNILEINYRIVLEDNSIIDQILSTFKFTK